MTNKNIIFGGVYKLTEKANKILTDVPGGMHEDYFSICNTQHYGYFFPVAVQVHYNTGNTETEIFMVDTFMIDKPNYRDFEKLVELFKSWKDPDIGAKICSRCYDYYYAGCFKLTDKTAPAFELVCDLSEVRPVRQEEAIKYERKDVLYGIQLYHEHNYSWDTGARGITLVNKDATPSKEKTLKQCFVEIMNMKLNVSNFQSKNIINEFEDCLKTYPELETEHYDEVFACKQYIKAYKNLCQLASLSLEPYRQIMDDYIYDNVKKDMIVHTSAGDLIASEKYDEYKGIELYFKPKDSDDKEILALAECHDNYEERIADETPDDIVTYTYTDDFGKPIMHVREAKALKDHVLSEAKVRPLTSDDAYNVGGMDRDSDFVVGDWLDSGRAYGLFDEDGFLNGYCTLGDADFGMPECVANDKLYDPNNSLVLSNVYVEPQLRHRGYALKMIREAIKQAWDSKQMSTSVYLNIVDDEGVAKLYEKVGFRMLEPKDEWYMVLDPKELL